MWLSILLIVPLVSFILWIMLIAIPSTSGKNNYGLEPPPSKTWHWIAGLVMPVLTFVFIIGLLAAIAIPQYQRYVERAQAAKEQSYESDSYNTDESYYTDEANDAQTESETTESEFYDDSESETLLDDTTEESTAESTDENSAQ